jgi:hypothetical protein
MVVKGGIAHEGSVFFSTVRACRGFEHLMSRGWINMQIFCLGLGSLLLESLSSLWSLELGDQLCDILPPSHLSVLIANIKESGRNLQKKMIANIKESRRNLQKCSIRI